MHALPDRGLDTTSSPDFNWTAQATETGRALLSTAIPKPTRNAQDGRVDKSGVPARPDELIRRLEDHGGQLSIADPPPEVSCSVLQGLTSRALSHERRRGFAVYQRWAPSLSSSSGR